MSELMPIFFSACTMTLLLMLGSSFDISTPERIILFASLLKLFVIFSSSSHASFSRKFLSSSALKASLFKAFLNSGLYCSSIKGIRESLILLRLYISSKLVLSICGSSPSSLQYSFISVLYVSSSGLIISLPCSSHLIWFIPTRPSVPVPLISLNKTVSALSSAFWATAIFIFSLGTPPFAISSNTSAKEEYLNNRPASSVESPFDFAYSSQSKL